MTIEKGRRGRPDAGGRTFPTLLELEKRHIAHILAITCGDRRRAARLLGISRWSLTRRMMKYGLLIASLLGLPAAAEWLRAAR